MKTVSTLIQRKWNAIGVDEISQNANSIELRLPPTMPDLFDFVDDLKRCGVTSVELRQQLPSKDVYVECIGKPRQDSRTLVATVLAIVSMLVGILAYIQPWMNIQTN